MINDYTKRGGYKFSEFVGGCVVVAIGAYVVIMTTATVYYLFN